MIDSVAPGANGESSIHVLESVQVNKLFRRDNPTISTTRKGKVKNNIQYSLNSLNGPSRL